VRIAPPEPAPAPLQSAAATLSARRDSPPPARTTTPTPAPGPAGDHAPALTATGLAPGTETAFGGTFHLVWVALALGLIPDFTRPRDTPAIPDLWAWLGRTARALTAPRTPDPLWPLLAELTPPPPGQHPGEAVPAHARRPGDTAATPPARADLDPLPALRARHGLPARETATPSAWERALLPVVRAHLRERLGRRAGAIVVRRPATVHVAAARLDVVFALEDASVALRLAGLDRDPGWLPSGGYDLRLHYR
jgi:hypothetical protein